MCKVMEDLVEEGWEKGRAEGRAEGAENTLLSSIKNLMESLNLTLERASFIIEQKDHYYKELLGMDILWYNEVSDIPDILTQIRTGSDKSKDTNTQCCCT